MTDTSFRSGTFLNRKYLLPLLGLGLAIATGRAHADGPQISEGVRVMTQVGSLASGPKARSYWINPQPPISAYMVGEEAKLFEGETDLLKFFQSLPSDIRLRGLWVTPPGLPERQTEEDRNRIGQLIQEARRQKILVYVCAAADLGGRSGLVGWECTQESPSRGSQTLRCIPRDKPHKGHPWWDC